MALRISSARSTAFSNVQFSDVLYIEQLIGPHTVNTISPATLNAFRNHGHVQQTLETGEQDAGQALARLAELGVDPRTVAEKLLTDGITAFTHSLDELLAVRGAIGLISARPWVWFDGEAGAESGGRESST
jgi:transaldolase